MKRLAAVTIRLSSLAVVQVASAQHNASGAQERAILQSVAQRAPELGR